MNDDSATIDSLIKGGLIGAFLGAILLKDKEEGAIIGALLGAAISATQRANAVAQNTNVPLYVEENGNLYVVRPSGEKQLIKTLRKPSRNFPKYFQLD
ncbi:MAG: hypothetical protein WBB36_11115 [Chitinophagales bacterium]